MDVTPAIGTHLGLGAVGIAGISENLITRPAHCGC
jgi:fatty acid-binding protein DegV